MAAVGLLAGLWGWFCFFFSLLLVPPKTWTHAHTPTFVSKPQERPRLIVLKMGWGDTDSVGARCLVPTGWKGGSEEGKEVQPLMAKAEQTVPRILMSQPLQEGVNTDLSLGLRPPPPSFRRRGQDVRVSRRKSASTVNQNAGNPV